MCVDPANCGGQCDACQSSAERSAQFEQHVQMILLNGPDGVASALADALEDAVEWNWMEDGVPDDVQNKVYAALESYNRLHPPNSAEREVK